jgi:hypothetical protein
MLRDQLGALTVVVVSRLAASREMSLAGARLVVVQSTMRQSIQRKSASTPARLM